MQCLIILLLINVVIYLISSYRVRILEYGDDIRVGKVFRRIFKAIKTIYKQDYHSQSSKQLSPSKSNSEQSTESREDTPIK